MNITIIGPGNMGRAIGTRAVAGGHSVTFVGRTLCGFALRARNDITGKQIQQDIVL